MEAVKELVFTLCLVSLAVGIFRVLAPAGGLQRTAVSVMGLFTLVCFFTPFTADFDVDSLFSFSLQELVPSENIVTEHQGELEAAAVDEVTQTVRNLAQNQQLSVKVTGVKLQREQGFFMVETLTVVVEGNGQQAAAFKEKLCEVLKCEVSVTWTKE